MSDEIYVYKKNACGVVEPDYDTIEENMRKQPDSYFLEKMTDWFKDQKPEDVPYLTDLADLYFNSFWTKGGLSAHFMARFIEILRELHGKYIQSARSDKRPPLDKQAMIKQAHWLLKREQFISDSMLHLAMSELED
ncbi:hypothetical protein LJC64_01695 [Ruminococcaceae bacterium OttesenSCG-928-A11]|nr:hypothetical protein [Ruminococcaceae bacterium OttesenSCG-928-A11]